MQNNTTPTHVNNNCAKKVESVDNDVVKTLWSKAFKGNFKEQYIHKVISGSHSVDNEEPPEDSLVPIPPNFIYSKGMPKGVDLTNRLSYWNCLDRRPHQTNDHNVDEEALKSMMVALRQLIQALAEPRIMEYFSEQLALAFPNVRWNGDEKIRKMDHLMAAITVGPWDAKMREVVDFALHSMWGTQNQWALNLEAKLLKMLKMKYDSSKMVDSVKNGGKPVRKAKNHPGDFIKDICVDKKNSMLAKVRAHLRRIHFEVFLVRLKQGVPGQLQGNVMYIRRCTKSDLGFNGMIGICEGHPDVYKNPGSDTLLWVRPGHEFKENAPDSPTRSAMMTYLESMDPKTPDDLMKIARELNSGKSELTDCANDPLMYEQVACLLDDDDSIPAASGLSVPEKAKDIGTPLRAQQTSVNNGTSTVRDSSALESTQEDSPSSSSTTKDSGEEYDELEETTEKDCPPEFHRDISNFVSYEGSYFTPSFREKKPYWPEECVQCKISFWNGEITMTKTKTARFCPNADKKHHCIYAFCPPCFQNRLEKGHMDHVAMASPVQKAILKDSTNKRDLDSDNEDGRIRKSARRRRLLVDQLLCGEMKNKDGNIVPSV